MSNANRILGVDPGLKLTGYAVLEAGASAPRLVEAGVLRLQADGALADRLRELFDAASDLFAEHRPEVLALEDLFSHYERPKTAVVMGHARGVIMLAAARANAKVVSYLPTKVKRALTGNGRASKEQMQRAIQLEFGLAEPPEPPDVADALAVALCHFHQARFATEE
jgi:crossover junction endodeoxyribonuclease RuvC